MLQKEKERNIIQVLHFETFPDTSVSSSSPLASHSALCAKTVGKIANKHSRMQLAVLKNLWRLQACKDSLLHGFMVILDCSENKCGVQVCTVPKHSKFEVLQMGAGF